MGEFPKALPIEPHNPHAELMTNRIVVGVDGSEHSAEALRWASEVGAARGWPVTAVTVWAYLDQRHTDGEVRFDPKYTQADARTALARYVDDAVGAERATQIDQDVCNDLPANALVEVAAGAGLLVVGARGIGPIHSLLLGSVSSACLHHAPCPVAVIRSGLEVPTPHERRRVVVGVDGSSEGQQALRWAAEHASATGSTLEVVHAWHTPVMTAGALAYVPIEVDTFETTAREVLDRMMTTITDVPLHEPASSILIQDRPTKALLDCAKGADLVVVGARGLGGFTGLLLGSVSDQLSRHAPCPVVVVRSHE